MPMQSTVRTAVLRILYVQYSLVILTQLAEGVNVCSTTSTPSSILGRILQ